jgi:flagellar protein FlbD
MIRLTRRNNDMIVINLPTIAYVEATPDTLITLTTGERIHVRESLDTVVAGAIAYQRKVSYRGADAARGGDGDVIGHGDGDGDGKPGDNSGGVGVDIRGAR